MKQITIDVSKKVNGKFQKQGDMTITVPLLADCLPFIGAEVTGEEDGLPVYADDKANWLQGAILAAVKAQARNKLVPGTATVKDGQSIPTDWEGLLAEGVRGGGEALAIAREVKQLFTEWVVKLGKSEAATNTLVTLFSNRQALALQSADNKAKVKGYVEQFIDTIEEDKLERYQKPIDAVLATCEAAAVAEDF